MTGETLNKNNFQPVLKHWHRTQTQQQQSGPKNSWQWIVGATWTIRHTLWDLQQNYGTTLEFHNPLEKWMVISQSTRTVDFLLSNCKRKKQIFLLMVLKCTNNPPRSSRKRNKRHHLELCQGDTGPEVTFHQDHSVCGLVILVCSSPPRICQQSPRQSPLFLKKCAPAAKADARSTTNLPTRLCGVTWTKTTRLTWVRVCDAPDQSVKDLVRHGPEVKMPHHVLYHQGVSPWPPLHLWLL